LKLKPKISVFDFSTFDIFLKNKISKKKFFFFTRFGAQKTELKTMGYLLNRNFSVQPTPKVIEQKLQK